MTCLFLLPPTKLVRMMLVCGLVQVAAYWFVASMASSGSHAAVPQPDTLLYCQAARQIAEGQPFRYTPGDQPSTGTTSHLYPFVLAVPYALGAQGDALLTAGFALNALFYLLSLVAWGTITCQLCSSPLSRGVACVLVALSGHAAYCALAQSDMGFFMAVSSALFAALLTERRRLFAALLFLIPWCRPEGGALALLFLAAQVVRRLGGGTRPRPWEWGCAAVGAVSTVGVSLFNLWLTGEAQFHSILHKGYFNQVAFPSSLFFALQDAVRMGRELFLGLPDEGWREFLFLPLLGAAFAWVGIWSRRWSHEGGWKELWWLAASLLGFGGVAASAWQGTNLDRYLAWVLPLWLLYTAEGLVQLARVRRRVAGGRRIPILATVVFQGVAAVYLLTVYDSSCLRHHQSYCAGRDLDRTLPPGASIGTVGALDKAYALPGRRFVHLVGMYSPDLLTGTPIVNLERLKHTPTLRFDYWLLSRGDLETWGLGTNLLAEASLPVDLGGTYVAKADWTVLDQSRLPVDPRVLAELQGWRLVDGLDVGSPEQEACHAYETFSRFHRSVFLPFGYGGRIGAQPVADVGRAIIGCDSMTPQLLAGKPVKLVLRTLGAVTVQVRTGTADEPRVFEFGSPLRLRVHVDGVEAGYFEPIPSGGTAEGSEVVLSLPAAAITRAAPRITVYGDHASLAYWFYQPE